MRFSVCVFLRCLAISLFFIFLLSFSTTKAAAQTIQQPKAGVETTPPASGYEFANPNVEADVPQNQHTLVQSIFIETLLALQCQLTGIDLLDPSKPCLAPNPQTGKIGYAPTTNPDGTIQFGGMIGMLNSGIATLYTPTFSSGEYIHYLSSSFGVVKPTYAAAYDGFKGLSPILDLWKATRDIAYYLLIVAFVFIGIGVMIRLKIDPRTVMTVQNQIPRAIICIILITFSFPIAGGMIDVMWGVTYMGVNKITENVDPPLSSCIPDPSDPDKYIKDPSKGSETVSGYATAQILNDPFAFTHYLFVDDCSDNTSGILNLSYGVGQAISSIETNVFLNLLGLNTDSDCDITSLDECPIAIITGFAKWVLSIMWFMVVFIGLLISLFRIWFELLKAYIMTLLYVILAPLWIVFGLLPKRPLGFEKWIRVYFANLSVFPAVVLILVAARVFHDLFNTAAPYRFVPPLVGNPSVNSFGMIIEVGMVFMAPQLLSLIREKLGTPPSKQFGAAMQTFNAGRSAASTPAKQALKHANQRDQYGNAVGFLAAQKDRATNKATNIVTNLPGSRFLGGNQLAKGHQQREYMKQNYGSARGFEKWHPAYMDALAAAKKEGPDEEKKFRKNNPDVGAYKINNGGGELPPHLAAQKGAVQTTTEEHPVGEEHPTGAPSPAVSPLTHGENQPATVTPTSLVTPPEAPTAGQLHITIQTADGGTPRQIAIRPGETPRAMVMRLGQGDQAQKEALANDWDSQEGSSIPEGPLETLHQTQHSMLGEFLSRNHSRINPEDTTA